MIARALASLAGIGLLAATLACGGGGGSGGGAEPTAQLTIEEAPGIAATGVATVLRVAELSAFTSGDAFEVDVPSSPVEMPQYYPAVYGCVIGTQINRLEPPNTPGSELSLCGGSVRPRPTLPASGTRVVTEACDARGSVRLTIERADAERPVPGDRIDALYQDCVDAHGSVLEGSLRLVLASWRREGPGAFAFDADTTLAGLTIGPDASEARLQIDGRARLSVDTRRAPLSESQLAGSTLSLRDEAGRVVVLRDFESNLVLDLDGDVFAIDAAGRLQSSALEGEITYDTRFPLSGELGELPDTGWLRLRGAAGAVISVLLGDDSVRVEADVDGDAVPDATTDDSWLAFLD
jgi:hypothetical protein